MNEAEKSKALRLFTYGLYILTSRYGDEVSAGTVSWVSQASFNPPLIVISVRKNSKVHEVIEKSGVFALNVLGSDQKDMAAAFFGVKKIEESRINGYEFEDGRKTGSPIFIDAPAWLECKVMDKVKRGDHTVFVAEVINAGVRREIDRPLILWDTGWHYGG